MQNLYEDVVLYSIVFPPPTKCVSNYSQFRQKLRNKDDEIFNLVSTDGYNVVLSNNFNKFENIYCTSQSEIGALNRSKIRIFK